MGQCQLRRTGGLLRGFTPSSRRVAAALTTNATTSRTGSLIGIPVCQPTTKDARAKITGWWTRKQERRCGLLSHAPAPPRAGPRRSTAGGLDPTATQAPPSGRARANGPDQDGTIGPGQAVVPGGEQGSITR
jgi:hypothetical protein